MKIIDKIKILTETAFPYDRKKNELIKYRLGRAGESLVEAKLLLEQNP